jgi:hypothetical protein
VLPCTLTPDSLNDSVLANNSENVSALKNDVDSYVVERWTRA